MSASWVLDDQGECWSATSRSLGAALHTRRQGAELTDFLVRQMGFVLVRAFPSHYELTYNAAIASPVALTSLFYWFADRPFRPTTCISPEATKVAAVFRTPLALFNHLGALIETRSPRPAYERFALDLDRSAFAPIWRAVAEICRTDMPLRDKLMLLDAMSAGDILVVERAANGDYELVRPSNAMAERDPDLCQRDHDRTLRDAFDRDFGAWTADQLMDVKSADAPFAEGISAQIAFKNYARRRYFYDRLVVPMVGSTGADALLIAVNRP